MSVSRAYIDTSVIAAIALNEVGSYHARRLDDFSQLFSSNLLEAEVRAALAREGRREAGFISGIEWVFPDRSLGPELAVALAAGYLRGADLWHIATALYAAPEPGEIAFVTLDNRQRSMSLLPSGSGREPKEFIVSASGPALQGSQAQRYRGDCADYPHAI